MGDMSWFRSLASCALGTSYDDLQNAPISNIEGDGVIVGQLTTGVYSISGTWKLTEDDRERQTPDDDLFYILNGENGTRVTWVSSVGMQTIYVPKGASITDVVVEGQPDYLENDSGSTGYIKNRPFYEDADGTVHEMDEKFVPNLSEDDDAVYAMLAELDLIDLVQDSDGTISATEVT